MKMNVLFCCVLCIIPTLLVALPGGAPPEACSTLMPNHGGTQGAPNNTGFFLFGEPLSGSYVPGTTYRMRLVATIGDFAGFFIQARQESNQEAVSSIVGTWVTVSSGIRTARCNGVDGDAITHSSRDRKAEVLMDWTAPATNVGRIHFFYSIVVAYSNIVVKLNATEERPSSTIVPPPMPPADAVFSSTYRQPEGCQQSNCAFYVEWRNNGEFIDFRMEGNAVGWIALGITDTNLPLNDASRNFSDILACQAESVGSTVNVKDLYLPGGGLTPSFDSSTNGLVYTSGRINSARIFCNFTRVLFPLLGQEGEDYNFGQDNFLFFLSNSATGAASDVPIVNPNVIFSSGTVNVDQGFAAFTGSVYSLPGEGSFPTSGCSPDDCDFYFRWGVNPNNPNYLTFFISADLTVGWAAIGVSRDRRMGGDEIDDVFGCTTSNDGPPMVADTYNVAGGGRSNVGDNSGSVGLVQHSTGVINGRLECTFSRIISVLTGEEGSDFNLDNSYYVIIGTGYTQGAPFQRHERNPEWSTSEVNLVRESSVDFDYSRIPLIKAHGIFMVLAWPILAQLGIAMARHMKPAMPNGGWFLLHRILVLSGVFFSSLAFLLIFVAYRNADTRGLIHLGDINGLGTAHFVLGITVIVLQFTNPIIALFRCAPNDDKRWIFNLFHKAIIGIALQMVPIANVMIGLFLFGDKITDPMNRNAYWVMVALVSAYSLWDGLLNIYFGYSCHKCKEKTCAVTVEGELGTELKPISPDGSTSHDPTTKPKKKPSPDHWLRWAGWIGLAAIAIPLGITIIGLIGRG